MTSARGPDFFCYTNKPETSMISLSENGFDVYERFVTDRRPDVDCIPEVLAGYKKEK